MGWLPELPSLFETDFYFRPLPLGFPTVTRANSLGPPGATVLSFQWVVSEAASSPVSVEEKEDKIAVLGGRDLAASGRLEAVTWNETLPESKVYQLFFFLPQVPPIHTQKRTTNQLFCQMMN